MEERRLTPNPVDMALYCNMYREYGLAKVAAEHLSKVWRTSIAVLRGMDEWAEFWFLLDTHWPAGD